MTTPPDRKLLTAAEYRQAQESPEFTELRRRFRSFAVPMTVAFLAWYLLYVLLSSYAHDFMSTKVFGDVNLGLLLGLGQFVTTFLITTKMPKIVMFRTGLLPSTPWARTVTCRPPRCGGGPSPPAGRNACPRTARTRR